MPKTTRAHGSGTRASRRSRGSRSGLGIMIRPDGRRYPPSGPAGDRTAGGWGGARRAAPRRVWPGAGLRELAETFGAVGQMQVEQWAPLVGQGLAVAGGLRR